MNAGMKMLTNHIYRVFSNWVPPSFHEERLLFLKSFYFIGPRERLRALRPQKDARYPTPFFFS